VNKAVLIDRDGTLIEERHYLADPERVVLERRAIPALKALDEAGYLLILVTNQSGIGRGLITPEAFRAVQERIAALLEAHGLALRAVYHCPHHPTEARGPYLRECDCRKPRTGMLESAIREHDLDRAASFMLGDSPADIQAGRAAGLRTVLVRTGYGEETAKTARPDYVADDLYDAAVNFILG